MRKEITVHYNGNPCYEITLNETFDHLADDIFRAVGDTKTKKICIVSDSNVAKIYLNRVRAILEPQFCGFISFVFEAGEQSKNMDKIGRAHV